MKDDRKIIENILQQLVIHWEIEGGNQGRVMVKRKDQQEPLFWASQNVESIQIRSLAVHGDMSAILVDESF